MTRPRPTSAPDGLSVRARRLYSDVTALYLLEPHQLAVLVKALEAFDTAEAARKAIGTALTVETRLGDVKVNPLIVVERDARAQFFLGMKQLGLDYEPTSSQAQTAAARAARWSA